jgi:hypothetical protein
VPLASLSIVSGLLLVALVFFQQALSMQAGLDPSNPLELLFLGMPIAVLAAVGGWLAELARFQGFWSWARRAGSPVGLSRWVLAGIAVAILVVVGLLALYSGLFEESAPEAMETAFQAANEGEYDTANEYLAPQMTRELQGDTRSCWDAATQNGSVTQTSTQVEEQHDESARVQIFLQYESGGAFAIVMPMTREGGRWRILPQ